MPLTRRQRAGPRRARSRGRLRRWRDRSASCTKVRTQVRSERAGPAERSSPPDRMTTACPIVSRMSGAKALIVLSIDFASKKLFWRIGRQGDHDDQDQEARELRLRTRDGAARPAPRLSLSIVSLPILTRMDVAMMLSSLMSSPSNVAMTWPSYMIRSRDRSIDELLDIARVEDDAHALFLRPGPTMYP